MNEFMAHELFVFNFGDFMKITSPNLKKLAVHFNGYWQQDSIIFWCSLMQRRLLCFNVLLKYRDTAPLNHQSLVRTVCCHWQK